MHNNDMILGIALAGLVLSFGCISWFAYEQGRLIGFIRKHIDPARPITRKELRDKAYQLFPNEFAMAKLFIGNVLWQIRVAWKDWSKAPIELRLSARRARTAMSVATLSVIGTFLVLVAVALAQRVTQ